MKEDVTICVCCEVEAKVIFKPRDNKESFAMCVRHAIDFQKVINHCGNYPVCYLEMIT